MKTDMQMTGRTEEVKPKPFTIEKRLVMMAYKRVKSNRGSAGVDQVGMEEFDKDYKNYLYKIWNQMSSGSYFPPAVRQVEIPKSDGRMRLLGIPTIADRVAQTVVAEQLQGKVESVFHPDSFGCRPNKSAHQAIELAKVRCWKHAWVLDLDIRNFYDTLPHDLLMKAVRRHIDSKWMLLYIERWLVAPVQKSDGSIEQRTQGVPQGSVIGPVLANLFLHYAMDEWLQRKFPQCPFERYMDDTVIHSKREADILQLKHALTKRLKQCGLDIHPEKTKIVFCKDSNRSIGGGTEEIQFDFLGYTFMPRQAQHPVRKESFTNWLPAVSKKSMSKMREKMREWTMLRTAGCEIEDIAFEINPVVRGWINYYGKFYKTKLKGFMREINLRIVKWARTKYLKVRPTVLKGLRWLKRISQQQPHLFAHWSFGVLPSVDNRSRMMREYHVRVCENFSCNTNFTR